MIGLEYILEAFHSNANQLSQELGISRYTIYDWLKERRPIPKKRISQLAEHFKLPEVYFNKSLLDSEKLQIQKAYIDRNTTFIEYEEVIVDDEGNTHEVTRYHSPEQSLSEHIFHLQKAAELIEEVKKVVDIEVDEHGDFYQSLIREVLSVTNTKDKKKIKMLQDVLKFLLYNDHEFGFMVETDERKTNKLTELFNLYK